MSKKTSDLFKELSNSNTNLFEYFISDPTSFINLNTKDFWNKTIRKSGKTKSDIINKADISYCYFYDIINGRKIPNRDKIIRIALSMHLSLEKAQEALRISGKSSLYPRIKRDSIIIFAINNLYTVYQTNELLAKHGEDMLK